MKEYIFDAEILQSDEVGAGAYVLFPFDPALCFGKKNLIKVNCTFDGEPYRGVIANMGLGPCIGVLKSIREKLGKGRGDLLHVVVAEDTAPRVVDIPSDLVAELEKNPVVKAFFQSLSYTNQKQYADYIASAKREETRAAHLSEAMEKLAAGVKKLK